ncbi:hypothetical protein Adt_11217 [Abeliophyllum distichum]|uniref:Uncharacterized protein n=1 Tax=Abeliophyllum distichum TaxID=126358 RepID=A0ABD1UN73_9LAMI
MHVQLIHQLLLRQLEVNDVRITDAEKDVAYIEGLFGNYKSQGQNANDDDDFEHPITYQSKLMITAQESLVGDDSSSKLKKKKTTNDEITPDAPLKRQKKHDALLQFPWVNQYDSMVDTTKRVVKGTFAFKVGLCPPYGPDIEAFESWYKEGLVTKNK